MKKVFLLGLIACFTWGVTGIDAQKKKSTTKMTKLVPATKPIVTANDSITYTYGMAMLQGLPAYLTQMGILPDADKIKEEYNYKIETATDEVAKGKLEKELSSKLDSIKKIHDVNLNEFLTGFTEAFYANKDKNAYHTGLAIAAQVSKSGEMFASEMYSKAEDFDKDLLYAAIRNGLLKKDHPINVEDPNAVLQERGQKIQEIKAKQQEEELKVQYKEQIVANEKFLEDNKTKDGVITLPSGLQYQILEQGNGAIPTSEDIVKVHYKGTLIDGTQFDSSYDRGEPISFAVGHVIKGWIEALQLMPIGSKWKLFVPQDLAYGARDQGEIKPFATLIFEMDLLEAINTEEAEQMMSMEDSE